LIQQILTKIPRDRKLRKGDQGTSAIDRSAHAFEHRVKVAFKIPGRGIDLA
jgi:hypothetical protein